MNSPGTPKTPDPPPQGTTNRRLTCGHTRGSGSPSLSRSLYCGIAVGLVAGGLLFWVACTAERQSLLHRATLALHRPATALIERLARKLHGSADAGIPYFLPVISLYWLALGAIAGGLIWALRSLGRKRHSSIDTR